MTKRPTNEAQPRAAAQPSLFDDDPNAAPTGATAAAKAALVAIQAPAAALSKAQRAFNRMVGQIRQQRELLASWQTYSTRHNQRLATEFEPLQTQLREARLALLRLLDQLVAGEAGGAKLAKPQRRKLRSWIPQMADQLLEGGPDAEIEAIFNRHSDISHADARQQEIASAEAVLGEMLGEDAVKGHQAQSIDELMQHAAQTLASQVEAEQQARQQAGEAARQAADARARQTAKGRQAEAARQQQDAAAQQASQSVREIFRKLASALHPDREPDPAERARKTQLMQQANQAYARNDLLTLLSMQLDIEQIDSQHLADLPDARLLHYNQVLREQLQALQQEVSDFALPFLMPMGLGSGPRQPGPATVEAALTQDIALLQRNLSGIQSDTARLRDPATRRSAIDEIDAADVDDGDDDGLDAFEAMLLMEALAGAAPAAKRARQSKRR